MKSRRANFFLAIVLSSIGASISSAQLVTRQELTNAIRAIYGSQYKIGLLVNVDSAIVDPIFNGKVQDPYGTLKHCMVFAGEGIWNPGKATAPGFVGIFRDGQIVWHSDTMIFDRTVRNPLISTITDLNADGKEEIVVSWYAGVDQGVEYLWVISWDGNSGDIVNDYKPSNVNGNESVIVSEAGYFEFVDLNGDQIKEIQGLWYPSDGAANRSTVVYSWNGQKYGKWPTTPAPSPTGFLPRNNLSVRVMARVSPDATGLKYEYSVENSPSSLQAIDAFRLDAFVNEVSVTSSPKNWDFRKPKLHLTGWSSRPLSGTFINRGAKDTSFSYTSVSTPAVLQFYVQGHNPSIFTKNYDENTWLQDIFQNSLHGFTIGPYDPPNPLIPSVFLDTLTSYKHQAVSLGWIDNDGVAKSLDQKLDNAKSQLQSGNTTAAKNALKAFINDVEAQKNKHLSNEAYALLKFNAEYLLSKIK